MSNVTALEARETGPSVPARLTAKDILEQLRAVQDVMQQAMRKGEHYGVIPGTGTKPTLLKPGAEMLATMFRLRPEFEMVESIEREDFLAFTIRCRLHHINTGALWGEGIGSCNSRETKYRYRSTSTGKPVPSKYWDSRDPDLLGGPQFKPRKVKKQWIIFEQVEHDNPWDYHNTLIKMAQKRALVAAVLVATACSDIFTQDLEDLGSEPAASPAPEPAQNGDKGSQPPPDDDQDNEAGIRNHAANRLFLMFCDERKGRDGEGVDAAMAWLQKRMKTKKKLSTMAGDQLSKAVDAINDLYEVWKGEGSNRGAYKNMEDDNG